MKEKNILIILLLLVSISFSISSVSNDPSDFSVHYSNATEKNTGNKNIKSKKV